MPAINSAEVATNKNKDQSIKFLIMGKEKDASWPSIHLDKHLTLLNSGLIMIKKTPSILIFMAEMSKQQRFFL